MLSIQSWLNRSSASSRNTPRESCRYYGFDIIRSISVFLVVGCHLAIGTSDAASACLHYNRIAVPLFSATSGFLLSLSVDKDTTGSVLRKRVIRIVPVQVVWTIVYLIAFSLSSVFLNYPPDYLRNMSLMFLVKAFLRGCASIHLWFLPSILYSSIVLVLIDRFLPRQKWLYIVASAPVFAASEVFNNHFANYDLRLLGYLLMGFGLFRVLEEPSFKIITKAAVPLLLIAVFLFGCFTNPFAVSVLEYVLVLLTMVVFSDKRIPKYRIIAFISSLSLLVYLVHILVACFVALAIKHFSSDPVGIPAAISIWLLNFLISMALAYLCRKLIPYLRLFCMSLFHISAAGKRG